MEVSSENDSETNLKKANVVFALFLYYFVFSCQAVIKNCLFNSISTILGRKFYFGPPDPVE